MTIVKFYEQKSIWVCFSVLFILYNTHAIYKNMLYQCKKNNCSIIKETSFFMLFSLCKYSFDEY